MFQLSWMFSENFDYWKYQEDKSHFDRLSASVDSSIASRVEPISRLLKEGNAQQELATTRNNEELAAVRGSNEKIDRSLGELNEGLGELNETVSGIGRSLEDVRWELSSININISTLSKNVVNGFEQTVGQLRNISQQVHQLIEISKSPEQTWSLEQFSIACECCEKGKYSEAISFVERAIYGDTNHSGYPLEYRFFMLLGSICMGEEAGPDFLDLRRSCEAFSSAINLCSKKDRATIVRAVKLGALCHLLQSEYDEARCFLANRNGHALDVEGYYLDAKIKILCGMDTWQVPFQKAIEEKPRIALFAASDPVFLKKKYEVTKILDEIVEEWSAPYRYICQTIRRNILENIDNRSSLLPEYQMLLNKFEQYLQEVERNLETAAELKKLKCNTLPSPGNLKRKYSSIIEQILFEIENAENRIGFVEKHNANLKAQKSVSFIDKSPSASGKSKAPNKTLARKRGILDALTGVFLRDPTPEKRLRPEPSPENKPSTPNTSQKPLSIPRTISEAAEMKWVPPDFL